MIAWGARVEVLPNSFGCYHSLGRRGVGVAGKDAHHSNLQYMGFVTDCV